ncbi:MAG: bifunctional DNA-formamidopyrimidine glycosylase/DNA-(apurinic or apyrimidinic site) lyase [Gammaproteobacteria bacterium]|nr:bifunctional DNA-formamidopyrimidine glycosylase/DNA-(apurinic or apyrimidinic site) lyase [Gammaproteobacteria bacterium]
MPELPEVETSMRGIAPYVENQHIDQIVVRETRLRWPVPAVDFERLRGQSVFKLERRAKYILMHTELGVVLLHLGMSGSVRVIEPDHDRSIGKHDHIDFEFSNGAIIRFNDPRRFGCCLLIKSPLEQYKLLAKLGPEPLSDSFNVEYLYRLTRGKTAPIKNVIMQGNVVVGVGNIYASESLFEAGIRPTTQAGKISKKRLSKLVNEIKAVLTKAIKAGGTTLSDFTQADGKPGYFRHELQVYGRAGEACFRCGARLKSMVIAQRNTFYCGSCQR